jgi:hypothetical protein
VTWLLLTNAVGLLLPFHWTAEPATKLLPLRVSVKAAPPTIMLAGDRELKAGAGLLTVKFALLDGPPPGAGFVTCTDAVPAVAMSVAGTEAVNCVALTNVAVRLPPLQLTTAPDTKFDPFTVSVKAGPPTVALLGESVVTDGIGFGGGGGVDNPPPQPTHPAAMLTAVHTPIRQ